MLSSRYRDSVNLRTLPIPNAMLGSASRAVLTVAIFLVCAHILLQSDFFLTPVIGNDSDKNSNIAYGLRFGELLEVYSRTYKADKSVLEKMFELYEKQVYTFIKRMRF
ncbi:hypothetical protein Y032_0197g1579 [Ancylostoma ceylanicum]|nr:hypothetical protein Y032_0197g1579 [Ancylostoma ceylanicum]